MACHIRVLFIALAAIVTLSGYSLLSTSTSVELVPESPRLPRGVNAEPAAIRISNVKSRYAFATLLAGAGSEPDYNENKYFINTRVLAYQLLHAPETRLRNRNIPFLVLVTEDIEEAARARLRKDGAVVVEVPRLIDEGYRAPKAKWVDCMTKLRLWELVDFERVTFIDADTILARPLDDIFDDPAVVERHALSLPDHHELRFPGAAAMPPTYVFAGNADHRNTYPAVGTGEAFWNNMRFFRGGFFVIKPDLAMLRYYTSLIRLPDAFTGRGLEDSLLNTVHDWDHDMPWQQINLTFNLRSPLSLSDVQDGAKSVHNKWWEPAPRDVRQWLGSWEGRMQEFYARRDGRTGG